MPRRSEAAWAPQGKRGCLNLSWGECIVEGTDKEAFRNENRAELNFWLYPEDGVNIPRNTPGIRFMWQNLGAISYRLQLTSSATDLIVYTNTNLSLIHISEPTRPY